MLQHIVVPLNRRESLLNPDEREPTRAPMIRPVLIPRLNLRREWRRLSNEKPGSLGDHLRRGIAHASSLDFRRDNFGNDYFLRDQFQQIQKSRAGKKNPAAKH
jgi:hypothetical protein